MSNDLYIDLGKTECFPTIGANETDNNERVILTFNVYPSTAMMEVPLWSAVQLAEKILWIANQKMDSDRQKKEAA